MRLALSEVEGLSKDDNYSWEAASAVFFRLSESIYLSGNLQRTPDYQQRGLSMGVISRW